MSTIDTYPSITDASVLGLQQKYHTVLVVAAEGLQPSHNIKSPLVRKLMKFVEHAPDEERFGRINLDPFWLLEDETPPPSTMPALFAFQISEGLLFERLASSPQQIQIDYFRETGINARTSGNYSVFCQ